MLAASQVLKVCDVKRYAELQIRPILQSLRRVKQVVIGVEVLFDERGTDGAPEFRVDVGRPLEVQEQLLDDLCGLGEMKKGST
jgi:hypothetical protein